MMRDPADYDELPAVDIDADDALGAARREAREFRLVALVLAAWALVATVAAVAEQPAALARCLRDGTSERAAAGLT